jgi:DNA-binding transcriptional LysR family regulator
MTGAESRQRDANDARRGGKDARRPGGAAPKLAHLRSFHYLARMGSMTAAADALGISQPTMSDHIEQLEQGFEDRLFTRGPTGVSLTATGQALQRTTEHSINQLDSLTFKSLTRPVLLGGPHDMLRERVLPSLASLLASHGVCVQIQPGIAEELLGHLRNRTVDLFIATRRLNAQDLQIKYHRLFQEEYVLVGNADWKQRIPPMASEQDVVDVLAVAPFLAFDEELPIIRDHPLIAEHEHAIFGPDPLDHVSLIMPELGALRNVAIKGGGVTVLPRYLVEDAIKAKKLYELYTPEDRKFNPIYLAHRDEPQNRTIKRIIAELRDQASTWETKEAKAAHQLQLSRMSPTVPLYEQDT